jgi:hypothetical protein
MKSFSGVCIGISFGLLPVTYLAIPLFVLAAILIYITEV